MDEPTFVNRDRMVADKDYVAWLSDVKTRFRAAQAKAMVRVNTAMLEFYWSIGRDLTEMHPEENWGKGIVKQFALDMRNAFPDETGFSWSNVKDMKRWYLFYFEHVRKSQQPAGFSKKDDIEKKNQQPVGFLEMPESFGLVPWGHHIHIVSKSNSLDEALFYINKTIEGNWSRSTLDDNIRHDLYSHSAKALTNFADKLPVVQGQLAQEMLKDPYSFEFLTMKSGYDEKELEDALIANITRFLLELGEGFAFVGRQKELRMPDGTSFFPDLIFYHIPQKRYVVIDLKSVKFVPEFAGKINFYVTAADKLLKRDDDNPSVGLIICKAYDKTIVEWSLKDIDKPLGVAAYQLQEVVERTAQELELKKKNELRNEGLK